MKRKQKGIETVEFAIVAPVAFLVLFGCIEMGRALFIWNTVDEVTRYGARVATVTNPATPDVVRAAMISHAAGLTLTNANINITYYKKDGTTTTTVLAEAADGGFVTVSVGGLTHTWLIPYVGKTFNIPAFSTTLPAESVGFVPS